MQEWHKNMRPYIFVIKLNFQE